MFFATNLLAYAAAALMILLLLGLAERQLGTRRTAVFYFAAQFAAVTLFLLLTQLARYADDGWLSRMVDARLMGPYAAVLAVSLASSGLLPTLWQRRLRTAVVSISLMLVLYVGHAETVVGFAGALAGLAAGWWIQGDKGTLHRHRSTGPRNPQPAGPHRGDFRRRTHPDRHGPDPHRAAGAAAGRRPEPAAHAEPAGTDTAAAPSTSRALRPAAPVSPGRWASHWPWCRWCCCSSAPTACGTAAGSPCGSRSPSSSP